MSTFDDFESVSLAIDDLRTFQHKDVPAAIRRLEARLESIERAVLSRGKVKPTGVLEEKMDALLPTLLGKRSGPELLMAIGIEATHLNLINLGRYLAAKEIRRGGDGRSRYYWFTRKNA